MPRFHVVEYALVRITSEPIEAEHAVQAYQAYNSRVDLSQLLSNVVGTTEVAEVQFDNYRESARVELLDENGDMAEIALELSEEEINDPEDLA
jgi:hypothetical protein